jgi:hypothetical protein
MARSVSDVAIVAIRRWRDCGASGNVSAKFCERVMVVVDVSEGEHPFGVADGNDLVVGIQVVVVVAAIQVVVVVAAIQVVVVEIKVVVVVVAAIQVVVVGIKVVVVVVGINVVVWFPGGGLVPSAESERYKSVFACDLDQ